MLAYFMLAVIERAWHFSERHEYILKRSPKRAYKQNASHFTNLSEIHDRICRHAPDIFAPRSFMGFVEMSSATGLMDFAQRSSVEQLDRAKTQFHFRLFSHPHLQRGVAFFFSTQLRQSRPFIHPFAHRPSSILSVAASSYRRHRSQQLHRSFPV
uniref:Transposase n=1 Tax=Steinernema glaseri TaxID=37863 RepID=A0A1I7Y9V8_9BILA